MGSFRYDEAEKYGGSGGGGYFSLKNDKDKATVRFMYNSIDDVEGYAVHQVEIDGKRRYVNCKRNYNDPLDACPFCRERIPQYAKLFIPVYDVAEDKVKVWERGKKFFQKISSICARYANDKDLVQHEFEIERNGKAGSQTTTYEIYEVACDDTRLDDLPAFEGVLGGIVLDKSVEDMEYYVENGEFPPEDDNGMPIRRSTSREEAPKRRTPVRNRERF